MPSNPVQIILNDADFLRAPDAGKGGGNKDFFENADVQFDAHKRRLLQSIDNIIAVVKASPYGPAAYLKVQMREAALDISKGPISMCWCGCSRNALFSSAFDLSGSSAQPD